MAEQDGQSTVTPDVGRERDRLGAILDDLDLQVAELDSRGCYRFVNRAYAQHNGLAPDAIVGRHFRNLLRGDKCATVCGRIDAALAGEEVRFCVRLPRPDGDLRAYEITCLPRQRDGRRDGVCIVTEDVTDRQRAQEERDLFEERLAQAQRLEALGTLAGGIAHDFNNILGAMMGYTELSLLKLGEDTPVRPYLEQVMKAADRAKNVVQQILFFSRKAEQQRHAVAVGPLVKEVLKLMRVTLPSTIEIEEDVDPSCGEVVADPAQLHQVVVNLCANAFQAMRDTGGRLSVAVHTVDLAAPGEVTEERYLQLSVSDTGCGMAPEVRKRVFEPYFTTRPVGEGSGMGLAVVHGIVADLGGSVSVESSPGEGSTFRAYLPTPQKAQSASPSAATGAPRGRGEHVLFVDDEEALARLGEEMLSALGYRATATTSSVEALQMFRVAPDRYDCVITDQTLPRMTGAELVAALLRLRPGLPIILCTGHSELIDAQGAQELGARAFLLKPLKLNRVARAVAAALGRP